MACILSFSFRIPDPSISSQFWWQSLCLVISSSITGSQALANLSRESCLCMLNGGCLILGNNNRMILGISCTLGERNKLCNSCTLFWPL